MKSYKYNKSMPVEDSTKGRAVTNPRNYKGDVMVQVWMDSRKLATLVNWLDNEGLFVRFMSEIVRETIDIVLDNLVRDEVVEMVEYTEDARSMLSGRFGVRLNATDGTGKMRGGRNIHHNLILDNRRKSQQIQQRQQPYQQPTAVEKDEESIDEMVARGMKVMKEKDVKEKKERAREELKRLKGTMDIDEDGVMKVKDGEDYGNSKAVTMKEVEDTKKKKVIKEDNGRIEEVKGRLKDADIRIRSDEEILEDRVRKDKKQSELLSRM